MPLNCMIDLNDNVVLFVVVVVFLKYDYISYWTYANVIGFCVYKMRLAFTVYGQDGSDENICVFLKLFSHFGRVQYILFFPLCESMGQYWDAFKVSWEYTSGSKEKPHLFLFAARVFWLSARRCVFVPQTQASTLILCQMKG